MSNTDEFCNRAEVCEALDDSPRTPTIKETIGDIINARYHRRDVVRGMLGVAAISSVFSPSLLLAGCSDEADAAESVPLHRGGVGRRRDPPRRRGLRRAILLRWGDPVFADAPAFDPRRQSAEAQLRQFGYNNDYVGFIPLDRQRRPRPPVREPRVHQRGGDVPADSAAGLRRGRFKDMTEVLVEVEMAAHGGHDHRDRRARAGPGRPSSTANTTAASRRCTQAWFSTDPRPVTPG